MEKDSVSHTHELCVVVCTVLSSSYLEDLLHLAYLCTGRNRRIYSSYVQYQGYVRNKSLQSRISCV